MFTVTGHPNDRMRFKVPSLRNVEKTGPYFHDGSVASLEDAVRMMARYQLGLALPDAEIVSITDWLKTPTSSDSPPCPRTAGLLR